MEKFSLWKRNYVELNERIEMNLENYVYFYLDTVYFIVYYKDRSFKNIHLLNTVYFWI